MISFHILGAAIVVCLCSFFCSAGAALAMPPGGGGPGDSLFESLVQQGLEGYAQKMQAQKESRAVPTAVLDKSFDFGDRHTSLKSLRVEQLEWLLQKCDVGCNREALELLGARSCRDVR